jgi:ABC-type thiamine transport system substrate-binding protein
MHLQVGREDHIDNELSAEFPIVNWHCAEEVERRRREQCECRVQVVTLEDSIRMRQRALRPRPHLMSVVCTGVVEVVYERPDEGGEQFHLREARRQAKVDDEVVHA